MRILPIGIFAVISLFVASSIHAAGIPSVLKIKTYEYDDVEKTFTEIAEWSAVYLVNKQIITNAHVIEWSEDTTPTGYYEVCFSSDFKKDPACFDTAKLVKYDTNADLAILELSANPNWLEPITPGTTPIQIGDTVTAYGYPGIGGNTITRTEWKIAGYEDGSYKIDATIDHGSSWGGAFNSKWEWVGIPRTIVSDNGLIGYVIPMSRISAFRNGKLDTTVKYKDTSLSFFRKNQLEAEKMLKRQRVSDDVLQINNIRKNGFVLVSEVKDTEGSMAIYNFSSSNKHVNITITCWKTAGTSTLQSIMQDITSVDGSQTRSYASWTTKQGSEIFIVRDEVNKETSAGKKPVMLTYFYPWISPACVTLITGLHASKDQSVLNQAEKFIKNEVTFKTQGGRMANRFVVDTTNTPYMLFSEMSSIWGVDHTFFVKSPTTNAPWISTSGVYDKKYGDMQELFSEGSDTTYTGKDFSWSTFFHEYSSNSADAETKVAEVTLPDGKKWVITSYQSSDNSYWGISLFVPYKDNSGKIHAFKLSFSFLPKKEPPYIQDIKNIFWHIRVSGSSLF